MSCLFCEIANGNIPSRKVYEDDQVIGFLDINPTSYGHTLFIPKEHADNALEASQRAHVFDVACRFASHLQKELGCEGVNILSNIGEQAGQTVFHFHVHVIPRYADKEKDQLIYSHNTIANPDLDRVQEILAISEEDLPL